MKNKLNEKYLASLCVGLDMFKAKNILLRKIPDIGQEDIDVQFVEAEGGRFKVLSCAFDGKKNKVRLTVSSSNPIKHLPLNYQDNDFLRSFLMIFQHGSVLK